MHLIDQIRAIERRYATLRGPPAATAGLRRADALLPEAPPGAAGERRETTPQHAASLAQPAQDVERSPQHAEDVIPTGWKAVDEALSHGAAFRGGLARGGLHEFFGVAPWPAEPPSDPAGEGAPVPHAALARHGLPRRAWRLHAKTRARLEGPPRVLPASSHGDGTWLAPLAIAAHLAWQALDRAETDRWVVWVGRISRPFPRLLARDQGRDPRLLERSIFVDPPSAAARLWAIDLALRCAAVEGVVADGSGLEFPATQRLGHLARTRRRWVLLLRPPAERVRLSAAHSRWQVFWRPPRGAGSSPRAGWILSLLRCKGVQGEPGPASWALEWDHAQGVVRLSAALADSAGAARIAAPPRCARPAAGRLGDPADRAAARGAARAVCV